MAQVMWILGHRRDLEADFRRFYGLSPADALALPGPEYLALAYRLDAYGGVITERRRQAGAEERRNVRPGARLVDSDAKTLQTDPALAGLIQYG